MRSFWCVVLLSLVPCVGWSAVLAPDDALGRWLDAEVVPQLGEHLARHPNFRGEVVGFVALAEGVPQAAGSALHVALEQYLRQRLLGVEGIRLALDGPRSACTVPQTVHYVIGIEISADAARSARVSLAMLDLQAGVWVSGVSHEWRGRLGGAQMQALAVRSQRASPGSADAPLQLAATSAVAAALDERLRCALPRGLDGAVYVTTPDDVALARVAMALQRELMVSPLAVLADSAADADWIMQLRSTAAGPGLSELSLELTEGALARRQRVAAVFVAAPTGPAVVAGPAPVITAAPGADAQRPLAQLLMSPLDMEVVERVGVCASGRGQRCAEVYFDVLEPAYLMVFSTREHAVTVPDCDSRLQRAEPGERRFRLRVGDTVVPEHGAAAGFYALAVRDRDVAQHLRKVLQSAPGACHVDADAEAGTWLRRLQHALGSYGDAVQWQALHLDEEVTQL